MSSRSSTRYELLVLPADKNFAFLKSFSVYTYVLVKLNTDSLNKNYGFHIEIKVFIEFMKYIFF